MPRRRRTEEHEPIKDIGQIKPTLDRFAEDTSMLGFRYLHTRYKTWFRVVWALVLFFFVGLTVYQVCERIAYYFIRNPLTTRRSYDTPQTMRFPTIGICNKMQLKVSDIAARRPDLAKLLCSVYDDNGQITRNDTILESLRQFDSLDMREVHKTAHQTIEDLFVSCELSKTGSCMENISPLFTPNGLCFAISPNVTVRRPGPETTLSLLLNLEIYEAVPGMVLEPGVLLSVHNPEQSKITEFAQGIHLEAGKIVTIPINEVRKLNRFESQCGRLDIGPFSAEEYSRSACEWARSMRKVEGICGCRGVASPQNRYVEHDNGSFSENTPRKRKYRKPIKPCSMEKEFTCVPHVLTTDFNGEPPLEEICPQDCEDMTYSSVVFGGNLVQSEISSLLPSDWEDLKEKKMSQFQAALDVIPRQRIPVVQDVLILAKQAQSFIEQATEIFQVDELANNIPCFNQRGMRILDQAFAHMKIHEPHWEKITSYIVRSLSRELNSTARAIGIRLDEYGRIQPPIGEQKIDVNQISLSLLQLSSTEASLSRPESTFGLRFMSNHTRHSIITQVLPMIQGVKECVTKLYDSPLQDEEIAKECRKIFVEYYEPFLNAADVYTMILSSSPEFMAFEATAKKITTALRRVKFSNRIHLLDWKDYNIDLKVFESLYREGGRDQEEIVEFMKQRKSILVDIIDDISNVILRIEAGLKARRHFGKKFEIELRDESITGIHSVMICLKNISEKVPSLKKNAFVRGEWLSRVHRQVQIAQSYSASLQYDQVNLLHIKLYFAHFKQETIVQDRSYNVFLLLAEIGGTIGLYVGATLLTVAETIVFFFEKRTRHRIVRPEHL